MIKRAKGQLETVVPQRRIHSTEVG
jgi:hypothetical protein